MNYYPFHIGDYVSATRHLSWEEDAAFRRLLDTYYTTEKPIPADLRAACRLVMAQTDSQREAVRVVLEEFFSLTDAGWINKRADVEIAAMREKQQKQRDKANKRWALPKAEPGNATAQQTDAAASKADADAMPPTPIPTPTPKGKTARKRAAPAVLVSVDVLVQAGVDRKHAADWLAVRGKKNLPLTETAWDETQAQAVKAGLPIGEAIRRAAAEGWAGFKASWLERDEAPRRADPQALTVPSTDTRADEFNAAMREREATMTRPPAAILALAGKAVRTA